MMGPAVCLRGSATRCRKSCPSNGHQMFLIARHRGNGQDNLVYQGVRVLDVQPPNRIRQSLPKFKTRLCTPFSNSPATVAWGKPCQRKRSMSMWRIYLWVAGGRDVRDHTILGRNQDSFAWYADNFRRSGAKKGMIWGMTDKTHRRVLACKKHGRSNKSEATAGER